jgi:hypothetical protein
MSVPGNASPLLLTSAAGAAAGYQISRSVRFNSSDSAYLSRTPGTAGNRKTWTWAGWVKRSKTSGQPQMIFCGGPDTANDTDQIQIFFHADETFGINSQNTQFRRTTQVFRDFSAWYHFIVAVDTTQGTANDRIKFYVNGSQVTTFSATANPGSSADTGINATTQHTIGRGSGAQYTSPANTFDGYLADVHLIDGQQLTPSSFGEFDTNGVWQPKAYTNGYPYTSSYASFFSYSNVDSGSLSDVFDGSTATEFEFNSGGGNGLFAPQGGVAYTTSVEIYSARPTTMNVSLNGGANVAYGNGWTTIASGSGTLSTLTFSNGNAGNQKLGAIRVDGTILTTGTFNGTNGFHLPFSDNSTAAALGTDTSGNGNTWTVNNISTPGTNYTSLLSPSTTDKKLFDGSTSTNFSFTAGQTYSITFPAPIAFTSIEAWSNEGNSNAIRVTINGSSVTDIGGANWDSLSGTSPLSSLSFTNGPGGSGGVSISAIRINGAPLVDGSASDIDSLVDSPTSYGTPDTGVGGEVRGNYCTWNALQNNGTLVNGNLDFSHLSASYQAVYGTVGISSGKWYFEVTVGSSGAQDIGVGIAKASGVNTASYIGSNADSWGYYSQSGFTYNNASGSSYGATYTTGDVIGVALDVDAGTLVFYKNNTSQGTAFSGLAAGTYFPAVSCYNSSLVANFGQRAFAYTAPSGFKALCTTNLPEPTIADGSTAMDVALYTGNGSTQTISGLNFSPDFVWIKSRSGAGYFHELYDTIRGATNRLFSNSTNAESANANSLTSFDSAGFTLGSNDGANESSQTYAAWTWDAGSSTVTNTQGSITSQVRANASAGFSVVTFNSGNSDGEFSVGHGLGVAPRLVIMKSRTRSGGPWWVHHLSATDTTTKYLQLSTTSAVIDNGGSGSIWGAALPTSTVFGFSVGAGRAHTQNEGIVSYCFAPVAGYSSFGSYTGNGSADGPFVFCNFRPRYVLQKKTSDVSAWAIRDAARDPYNAATARLWTNFSSAESSADAIDLLSNGFKVRNTDTDWNANGATYIYAAFAEHPFSISRAR